MAIREINLVPPEVLSKRYMLRHLYLWAGCLCLSMLLIAGLHTQQAGKMVPLKGDEASLNETASKLSTRISEIRQRQAELDTIGKERTLLDVVGKHESFSQVLLRLSHLLNEQTWFSRVSAVPGGADTDAVSLQVTGLSTSNDALGEFLNQLSFDPSFSDVVLRYSREGRIGGSGRDGSESRTGIQFLLECSALSAR